MRGTNFYGYRAGDEWFAQMHLQHSQLRRPATWAMWEYPDATLEVFEGMHDLVTCATAELNIGFSQWNILSLDHAMEVTINNDETSAHEAQIELNVALLTPPIVRTGEPRMPRFFQPISFRSQPPPPLAHYIRISLDFEMCAFPLFADDPPDFNHKRMTFAANGNPVISAGLVLSRHGHPHEIHIGWWGLDVEPEHVGTIEGHTPILHYFTSELDLLLWVVYMLHHTDADYVTGWNTLGFDMPYLLSRLRLGPWRPCPREEVQTLKGYFHYAQDILRHTNALGSLTRLSFDEKMWVQDVLANKEATKFLPWSADVATPDFELGALTKRQAALALIWWDMTDARFPSPGEKQACGIWIETGKHEQRSKVALRVDHQNPYWIPVWLADDVLTEQVNAKGEPPLHPRSRAASQFVSEEAREKEVRAPRWALAPKNYLGHFCVRTLQEVMNADLDFYQVYRATPASRFAQLGRQNPWTQPAHILRRDAKPSPPGRKRMPPSAEMPGWGAITRTKEQVTVTAQRQFRRENILTNGKFYSDEMLAVQNRKPQLPSFSLDSVATSVGLGKYKMGYERIPGCWSEQRGTGEMLYYVGLDALLPTLIQEKHGGLMRELKVSQISNTPIRTVVARGASLRGVSMIKNALERYVLHKEGELCRRRFLPSYRPQKGWSGPREPFVEYYRPPNAQLKGAFCLRTTKGWQHEPVVVFDFASLYPNSIREMGLCFSTMIPPGEDPADLGLLPTDVYTMPIVDIDPVTQRPMLRPSDTRFMVPHINSRGHPGVTPVVLEKDLLDRRKESKRAAAKAKVELDTETEMLETATEQALKLMANSIYGFVGAKTSPLMCYPVASSTTGCGRYRLMIIRYFTERKYTTANGYPFTLRIVAGDTDSVMARFDGVRAKHAYPSDVRQRYNQSKTNAKRKKQLKKDGTLTKDMEEEMLRAELIPATDDYFYTVWTWAEVIEADMNRLLARIRPCNILANIPHEGLNTTEKVAMAIYAEEQRILDEEIAHKELSDAFLQSVAHWVTTQAMEAEKIFVNFASIQKKRYLALKVTPFVNKQKELLGFQYKPDIMGLDAKRRNTIQFISDTQKQMIQLATVDGRPQLVIEYAQRRFYQLEARLVPLHQLASSCSLSRPISQYKSIAPAVAIARRQRGSVAVGTRFEYLIVEGPGKLNERAYTLYELLFDESGLVIDIEYYLRRFLKAILPIVAVLKARDRERLPGAKCPRWEDWDTMVHARANRVPPKYMDHSKDVNTDLLASYFRRTTDVRPSDTRPPRDRPKPKNNALLQFVQQRKRCTTPKCPNVVSAGQTMCSECAADPGRLRDTIVGARLRHAAYDLMLDRLHKKCEECVGGCSESHQEDIQRCTAYTCPIYSETHFARQQRDTWRTQVDSTETLDKIKRGLPKQGLDTTFTEVPGRDWTQIVPADLVDDLRDLAF